MTGEGFFFGILLKALTKKQFPFFMGLGVLSSTGLTLGDFNTQLPHMVIRNRVGFPDSIKMTPYTAASKGART